MTTDLEILPPRLTRAQARPILTRAKTHWRSSVRHGLLFAVELARLHEGEAHVEYGYAEFGEFIEGEFEGGVSAANARKLSRMGAALLQLERNKRVLIGGGAALPVGTTGVRALAAIETKQGAETMLAVFDRAHKHHPRLVLSDAHIRAAQRELCPPPSTMRPAGLSPAGNFSEPEQPYAPEDEERLDPAALTDVLRQFADDLDRELLGEWDGTPSPEAREDAERELQAIRARLDRLQARLNAAGDEVKR